MVTRLKTRKYTEFLRKRLEIGIEFSSKNTREFWSRRLGWLQLKGARILHLKGHLAWLQLGNLKLKTYMNTGQKGTYSWRLRKQGIYRYAIRIEIYTRKQLKLARKLWAELLSLVYGFLFSELETLLAAYIIVFYDGGSDYPSFSSEDVPGKQPPP